MYRLQNTNLRHEKGEEKNKTQNEDYNRFGSISQKLTSLCRRLLRTEDSYPF
jgi:hypothetical protein